MLKDQLRSRIDQGIAPVRIHPRLLQNKRTLAIGLYCLGTFLLFFLIAVMYQRIYHVHVFYVPFLLANPNLLLWLGMMCLLNALLHRGSLRMFEQKRQAVVRGEKLLQAEQQPASVLSEQVVAPIILEYRTNWPMLLTLFGCATFFVVLAMVANIWLHFSSMEIAFFLGMWIFLGVVSSWMWVFRTRHQLLADEYGLTMTNVRSKKIQSIPWHDARLFAIDDFPSSGKKKSKGPFQFELASKQEVICWYGNLKEWPNAIVFSLPVLPADAYLQQLQMLHVLIAQKTGLPLVDLRSKY